MVVFFQFSFKSSIASELSKSENLEQDTAGIIGSAEWAGTAGLYFYKKNELTVLGKVKPGLESLPIEVASLKEDAKQYLNRAGRIRLGASIAYDYISPSSSIAQAYYRLKSKAANSHAEARRVQNKFIELKESAIESLKRPENIKIANEFGRTRIFNYLIRPVAMVILAADGGRRLYQMIDDEEPKSTNSSSRYILGASNGASVTEVQQKNTATRDLSSLDRRLSSSLSSLSAKE